MKLNLNAIKDAQTHLKNKVVNTPTLKSDTLSKITKTKLYLKFENLQFTASFKERGAINKLRTLTPSECKKGVVAMSAGNHAQAVAYHATKMKIPSTIVMPKSTPNTKIVATSSLGAEVILHGDQLAESFNFARDMAHKKSFTFVHPYDDPYIIAGQGTLALEMHEQVSNLDTILVCCGGGGLLSGVSIALRELNPNIEIIGVQTEAYPNMYNLFHNKNRPSLNATLAEGIGVKRPGKRTSKIIKNSVDDMVLVSEANIQKAILMLLEFEKTVVEGAGAAGLAALLEYPNRWQKKKVGIILSGGNIDLMVLSSVIQRGLVDTNRLIKILIEMPDRPGALAQTSTLLGELGSNIVEINHQRAFSGLTLPNATVELTLECRGIEHSKRIKKEMKKVGIKILS